MSPEEKKRIAEQKIRIRDRNLKTIERFASDSDYYGLSISEEACRAAVEYVVRTEKRNQVLTHPDPTIRKLAQEAWIKFRSKNKND